MMGMQKLTDSGDALARELRGLRQTLRFSQDRVAREIGIDRSHLSRLERNKATLTAALLARLLDTYCVHSAPERARLLALAAR